ncbi:hypothetical protein SVTN_17130 [Streptomyces vietnamensis]|uniref:Uncharacterized protein n=1 Tax=Streptomyces vietnamensis TaxID=362257 RepID=A0A0B5I883_9ACTN|nr:hypothetical protein SVTN_17130 [Streptomyces vietnamensis]
MGAAPGVGFGLEVRFVLGLGLGLGLGFEFSGRPRYGVGARAGSPGGRMGEVKGMRVSWEGRGAEGSRSGATDRGPQNAMSG